MFSQTRNVRDSMHAEFNRTFAVDKHFETREELKNAISTFGKKYNVVFSIKDSHPGKGQYAYICKHGGFKRDLGKKDTTLVDEVTEEIIDLSQNVSCVPEAKTIFQKSTQKFLCPASITLFGLTVTKNNMIHNHPISQDVTTYAIHRKQSPEIMARIYSLLSSGHKDPVTSVMDTLKALNVKNIIKKDIQNIQSLYLNDNGGKEMYSLITELENPGRWPEAITIDATYKTNAHKMSLVNIVGTCNASSVKGGNRLQTFAVAAAFVNSETEGTYQWILKELREAVWPTETSFKLPSVIVTDNEQAIRNAIETVFPESQHLLCSWHLWNTMSTKLAIGKIASVEYNLRIAEAESEFKAMMNSSDLTSFQKASDHFQQIITTVGYFKENGQIALSYLRDVLMKEDEMKRWAGFYANQHVHMGNRTSGRAESFHSGLKKALGSQSASRMSLTTKRMHASYEKKREDRYRRLTVERISISSVIFDESREYRFKDLAFKVVRFAMDKIRTNLVASMQDSFLSKGKDCNCWDRARYNLPCPCIISNNPGVLPLSIVDERWRFERDDDYEEAKENEDDCKATAENTSEKKNDEVNVEKEVKAEVTCTNAEKAKYDLDSEYDEILDTTIRVQEVDEDERSVEECCNEDGKNMPAKNDTPLSSKECAEEGPENNRERMILRVEKLLHGIFTKINSLGTQQEISDAIKVLEKANLDIKVPVIKMDELQPPSDSNYVKSDVKVEKETSHYDRVTSYRNAKKDVAFNWIYIHPKNVIAAIHNVGADGNCGFRAVALEVFNDQSKWIKVKHQMLETYLKYHDTLYKPVDEKVIELERIKMVKRLNSTKSPCLNQEDQILWFSTFSCPQVVADTFERPVILFSYVKYPLKETGQFRENHEAQVFFPLINMPLQNVDKPISLLYSSFHFYVVEFHRTPTGRIKKSEKPAVDMDHDRLRRSYPDICSEQDYAILY
ncbi:hypothetical protein INT47_006653 [Mucor saturninus]|uniref:MULE transposase domain-containing protein n=1 Tax=Mucor saturninus TaxID=64648 RepID=A0A8H7QFR0_9FUNG|nr:hypothetical protein INT47_006653 [Mucor saturninus]